MVSMVRTPEYQLNEFSNITKSYTPNTYLFETSEHLVIEVKKCTFSKKQTNVNFDVVSLFSNKPLNETIGLIL